MKSIERERSKSLWTFVAADMAQNLLVVVGNLAVAISGACQATMQTFAYVKYDQARKYAAVSDGDLGLAIGCPGHFTGECQHTEEMSGDRDDDDHL